MKEIVERFLVAQLGMELPVWAKGLIALTNVFLVLAIAWVVMGLLGRTLRMLNARLIAKSQEVEERKRIETLIRVFRYIASVVVGAVTIMLVLSEIGISIAPILATAGVAGLAVGFGAQSLVKDYFTGFVMLLENQIRVGDSVEVGGKSGLVEEVTLRYVRLRDLEGFVHFVPNGVIATVTNRSRDFAFAMVDVGVGYRENLDRVFDEIRKVGQAMGKDPVFGPKILDEVDISGVQHWGESAVTVRSRIKTQPNEDGVVRREFLRRLKLAFDQAGIEIPFPSRTVYTRQADATELAADPPKQDG